MSPLPAAGDSVRFFTEFDDFDSPALPGSIEEYRRYAQASVAFVRARNERIDAYRRDVAPRLNQYRSPRLQSDVPASAPLVSTPAL